jgi:hypothetical protein
MLILSSLLLGHPIVVTAQTGPAVATPGAGDATVELLFTTIVPAAALPVAPLRDFLLWQATIEPGVTVDFPPGYGACCPGPLVAHVLSGELTLRVEGSLQVLHTNSTATQAPGEDVVPGTDVVLRPGDTALWRFELPTTFANSGVTPLRLISGGLFGGYAPAPVEGYQIPDFVELVPAPPLPPGPVTMELVRVDLPPGTGVAAAPVGALRLTIRESGAGVIAREADGAVVNRGRTPVVVDVLTLFPHAGAGTLMP